MASKIFKYGQLFTTVSGHTPQLQDMIAGELALNLHDDDTHLWASDGTRIIDLGAKLGGQGDELTIHSEMKNGVKTFSGLVRLKDVTADFDGSTPAKTLPANVQKRYALVNVDGENIMLESGVTSAITSDTESAYIDQLKDSSIVEIYRGTKYDEVASGTGVVTKYQIGDVVPDPSEPSGQHTIVAEDFQYLNFVYVDDNGEYFITKINLRDFITEQEFASGVTWDSSENKVRGVVDALSEQVISAWTDGNASAAGVADGQADVLIVDADGFKVENIQTAINARHANVIKMNGYVSGGTEDVFEIASGDTIMQAIKKIEDKLESNGNGWDPTDPTAIVPNQSGLVFIAGGPELVLLSAGTF